MAEKKLTAKLGLDKKEFDKNLQSAQQNVQRFGDIVNSLGITASFAAITAGIVKVVKESVDLAEKAEGIRKAFKNLNDPNLLSRLQSATHGTVNDVTLMTYAVRANNFKISLQQLPTYFEFASKRARETGESVDYLVESIVTGIGRKSALILDNLGISSSELNEQLKKTPDYADAVGAIIAKNMKDAGGYIDSAADKAARLNATLENNKELLGRVYIAASFKEVKSDLLNTILTGITGGFKGVEKDQKVIDAAKNMALSIASYFSEDFQKEVIKAFDKVQKGLDNKTFTIYAAPVVRKEDYVPIPRVNVPYSKMGNYTPDWGGMKMPSNEYDITNIVDDTEAWNEALDFNNKLLDEQESKQKQIESHQEAIRKQQEAVNSLYQSFGDIFNSLGNAIGGAAGEWTSYFGKIISTIPQAISAVNALSASQRIQSAANAQNAGTGAAAAVSDIPIVGPALAVAAIASVMGAIMSMPKLAMGGLAYGPTTAMIGEYSGASNNPEVVAPLNKLQGIIGRSINGKLSTRLRGSDLMVAVDLSENLHNINT